ncbi:unnamed protein product [Orchesella dallaii]|uniref:C-type lectin domain-containing protein n=1 Tax=Orchesella dallaii TaxID=48710 RepID=A0ABP1RJ37_9HEXA
MKIINGFLELYIIMQLLLCINAAKDPCDKILETPSKKYLLCNMEAEPEEAEKFCSSRKTRLLAIESSEENLLVTRKLRERISAIWLSTVMPPKSNTGNGYLWSTTLQELNFTSFSQSTITGRFGDFIKERENCPCDCKRLASPPPPVTKPVCVRPTCKVSSPKTLCKHIQPQRCNINEEPVCTSKRGKCNVECDVTQCTITQPECTIDTSNPICYLNPVQQRCNTTKPHCRITPGTCEPKMGECKTTYEDSCKVTTKPCINKCSQQKCESVTPPCTVTPERCVTKNNSCIPSTCPVDRKKRDADGNMRCPPTPGCKPTSPECFPETTHCPPAVTICDKPFVDCSPEYCQSTVQICNPPKIVCPPVEIICQPPKVECEDAVANCPEPEVICENPEVKCGRPIVKCPDPVVNCNPIVTTCEQPSYSCSNAKGTCEKEPIIKCGPPVVCPVQNEDDINVEKQESDYQIGSRIDAESTKFTSTCDTRCCVYSSGSRYVRNAVETPEEITEVKCIAVRKDSGFNWEAEKCDSKHKFICEEGKL